jgi:hypothetical protein
MELDPYLAKQVALGMDGADIMHGHLKVLMVDAEQQLDLYTEHDEEQWDQTVERLRLEGYLEALSDMYALTYAIAFEAGVIKENQRDGHL